MTLGHIKTSRGFTLIELLVVIAIIGILSSVVLASLNTARNRGADAAIKSNLANARAQAELYYDSNNNTYTTLCASGTNNIAGLITATTNAGGTNVQCEDTATGWAANAQLKSTTQFFCVDYMGNATTTSTDTISAADDIAC
ncbi:MAG TPA: type II secretion system protein [Candidatus Paceibacterota bacterium]|nr:type II secretion system protein [Candidatus Paceibacterota bacterium]